MSKFKKINKKISRILSLLEENRGEDFGEDGSPTPPIMERDGNIRIKEPEAAPEFVRLYQ